MVNQLDLNGWVMRDTNGNGKLDKPGGTTEGDQPIAGVKVVLKNSANDVIAETLTKDYGGYRIVVQNIPQGKYKVYTFFKLLPGEYCDPPDCVQMIDLNIRWPVLHNVNFLIRKDTVDA